MSQNPSLEQYIKELKNIFYLTSSLQNSTDVNFILDKILSESIKITNASSGSIMFKHDLSSRLFFYASQGHTDEAMNSTVMSTSDGIAGTVISEGIPKIINNISLDPKYIVIDPSIQSEMAIPIKINNTIQGVLVLDSTNKDHFTDKDLEFAQMICTYAGYVISNCIYQKQIQKQQQLIQASLLLPTITSSQEIFTVLCKELSISAACILNKDGEVLFSNKEMIEAINFTPDQFKEIKVSTLDTLNSNQMPYTRMCIPNSTQDMVFIADAIYTFQDNITHNITYADQILYLLTTKDYKFQRDETLSQWAERKMDEEAGQVYDIAIGAAEKELISAALKKNKDNRLKTSNFLGINRNTLRHKIEVYGLEKK